MEEGKWRSGTPGGPMSPGYAGVCGRGTGGKAGQATAARPDRDPGRQEHSRSGRRGLQERHPVSNMFLCKMSHTKRQRGNRLKAWTLPPDGPAFHPVQQASCSEPCARRSKLGAAGRMSPLGGALGGALGGLETGHSYRREELR